MAFIGAINGDMRAMISELVPKNCTLPIYVGCSGNFTIERIIAGMGIKQVHSNDVSLYSCAVGSHLAGEDLEISIKDDAFRWLEPYMGKGIENISTLLLCSDMFKFMGLRHKYDSRMWQGYKIQWDGLYDKTRELVTKALDGIHLDSFTPGDCVDFIQDAPEECMALCFPPTYKGGYERLYKAVDRVFAWDAPQYTMFDDARFEVLQEEMKRRTIWVISRDKPVEELEPYLRGLVKPSRTAKPVCMYAGMGNARFTTPRTKTEILKVGRLDGEIQGDLRLIYITSGQMNLLRAEYLKASINPASTTINLGVMVGDKLIGAIGLTSPMFLGNFCDVYLMADFAIRPTIYRRLAKLVLAAAVSKEVQAIAEQNMAKKVETIGTTVFTDKPVSMKYRGLFDLKGRRDDGRLIYVSRAGQWDLAEGFEWWKKEHSQTR